LWSHPVVKGRDSIHAVVKYKLTSALFVKGIRELRGLVSGAIPRTVARGIYKGRKKGINFVISAYVDAPASDNAGGAVRVRARDQFVCAAAGENHGIWNFSFGTWSLGIWKFLY
jgi:hypothetical protein